MQYITQHVINSSHTEVQQNLMTLLFNFLITLFFLLIAFHLARVSLLKTEY